MSQHASCQATAFGLPSHESRSTPHEISTHLDLSASIGCLNNLSS